MEARPFASLSAGLLARKGQAKPAMRPFRENAQDDLGWNDMGHDSHGAANSPVHEQREQIAQEFVAKPSVQLKDAPAKPTKLSSGTSPKKASKKVATLKVAYDANKPSASESLSASMARKAAFTLRLDPARHLRLRLACAVTNRSAQQIVVEALDELLDTIPQLDDLARQVPPALSNRNS